MKLKLDKEEQELLESFENGEWVRVANPEAEIRRHQQYARNTIRTYAKPKQGIDT